VVEASGRGVASARHGLDHHTTRIKRGQSAVGVGIKMSFSEEIVQRVWEKAKEVAGYDPNRWRLDECGALIGRKEYGNPRTPLNYVWEIDHIVPESEGGRNELPNLRPLQWENNASKQAGRLVCRVVASGNKNTYTQ